MVFTILKNEHNEQSLRSSEITVCRSQVEKGAIVAAGAVVEAGTVVPSGELWAGNPARKLRDVKPKETEYLSTVRCCAAFTSYHCFHTLHQSLATLPSRKHFALI